MSSPITVARLTPAHREGAFELRRRALAHDPQWLGASYGPEEAYLRAFSGKLEAAFDRDDEYVLGAFEGDGLVGMVGFRRLGGVKLRHRGYLWGMYVDARLRGRGVGRRIVEEVIARARALEGIEVLELTVVAENIVARGLYERVGFVAWGVQKGALVWNGRAYDEAHLALDLRR
jgi:RimJ/RimL family protein N-acetyltransferase